MSYQSLEIDVIRWAEARQIVQNSNIQAQARKTLEEAGELLEAASALQVVQFLEKWDVESPAIGVQRDRANKAYKDALGDVLVTLIVGAATADLDLVECLGKAYEEIKDRKGYLTPQGVFVKEPNS